MCPAPRLRLSTTLIVMVALPFGLIRGIWLLWLLDYGLSVAVGFIALAGVSTELGVTVLVFLEEAVSRFAREGRLHTTIVGLLSIRWGSGTGSETMRRIAAPMVGGLVSATVLTSW